MGLFLKLLSIVFLIAKYYLICTDKLIEQKQNKEQLAYSYTALVSLNSIPEKYRKESS